MDLDAVVDLDAPIGLDGQTSAGFDAHIPFDSPLYTFNGVLVTAPPAPVTTGGGGRPVHVPRLHKKVPFKPIHERFIAHGHASLGHLTFTARATVTRHGVARSQTNAPQAHAQATRTVNARATHRFACAATSVGQRTVLATSHTRLPALTSRASAQRTTFAEGGATIPHTVCASATVIRVGSAVTDIRTHARASGRITLDVRAEDEFLLLLT